MTGMKLYEIRNGMIDTLDIFLESEQTEMDRENYNDIMEYLKEELKNKSSDLIKYIRNLELENTVTKLEIERLEKLKKGKERKIKSIKNYIKGILINLDKKKVETELGNLSLRKTISVEIIDISKIPKEYLVVKEEVTPSKKLIGDSLKKNILIDGAVLKEDYSVLIK
ncbi:siphovirus Gp157 family protein [Fusobacterium sp.]|uniref:siphovirus Gp157 family protein n=1 Tax=Fusobacterium sp. TaxID=68766 RepID=UPI002E780C8C|nr:siphovirus Gp157 family protein [Fusobacterium sp.]MEE1477262.1 siphovirus Gp157 family protein [Fusobacterium sp.]